MNEPTQNHKKIYIYTSRNWLFGFCRCPLWENDVTITLFVGNVDWVVARILRDATDWERGILMGYMWSSAWPSEWFVYPGRSFVCSTTDVGDVGTVSVPSADEWSHGRGRAAFDDCFLSDDALLPVHRPTSCIRVSSGCPVDVDGCKQRHNRRFEVHLGEGGRGLLGRLLTSGMGFTWRLRRCHAHTGSRLLVACWSRCGAPVSTVTFREGASVLVSIGTAHFWRLPAGDWVDGLRS